MDGIMVTPGSNVVGPVDGQTGSPQPVYLFPITLFGGIFLLVLVHYGLLLLATSHGAIGSCLIWIID